MDLPSYVSMHFFSRDFELLKMSEATFTPKHDINQVGGSGKAMKKIMQDESSEQSTGRIY